MWALCPNFFLIAFLTYWCQKQLYGWVIWGVGRNENLNWFWLHVYNIQYPQRYFKQPYPIVSCINPITSKQYTVLSCINPNLSCINPIRFIVKLGFSDFRLKRPIVLSFLLLLFSTKFHLILYCIICIFFGLNRSQKNIFF